MTGYTKPQPLPGGIAILYRGFRNNYVSMVIGLYVPATGEHRVLTEGTDPWFAASGHVVFSRGSDLWALPFDVNRLEALSEPVLVLEGVRGRGQVLVGRDGTLVYAPSSGSPDDRHLVWLDRNGNEEMIDAPARPYRRPRISPDGTRVVMMIGGDIWVHELERGTQVRLTSDPATDVGPIWTPDGGRIVFASDRDRATPGVLDLFWTVADGTGPVESLHVEPQRSIIPQSWSGDGQTLLAQSVHLTERTAFDIGALTVAGERRWVTLLRQFNEFYPEVSPDGRWLAYRSDESGQGAVYIQPYPDLDGKWPIATGVQSDPVWSPAGRELFYQQRDRRDGPIVMTAVSIEPGDDPPVSVPRALFEDRYFKHNVGRDFDVAPDGRFLMLSQANMIPAQQINIIRNWHTELLERAAVD